MNDDLNAAPADGRPPFVPEKFWDETQGQVRLEALCNSYRQLERRFGESPDQDALQEAPEKPSLPASHRDYRIEIKDDLLDIDDDVNERLHCCGFSNEQAQLVYDIAAERVVPLMIELAGEYNGEKDQDKLERHFGGEERWAETAHQIQAWAKKNLPEDVRKVLSGTAEGVITMHRMMTSGEPGFAGPGEGGGGSLSEERLKTMMQDPRYWRDKDPSYHRRIAEGFKRLYPGEGA